MKVLEKLFNKPNKWIIKPINGSFRAGIHVVHNINSLLDWINQYINTYDNINYRSCRVYR